MFPTAESRSYSPGDWKSLLPLSLLCLLALAPHHAAADCLDTAWTHGVIHKKHNALLRATAAKNQSACCSLCLARDDCASIAYHTRRTSCRLYGQVASYATFVPQAPWTYLVRPGRSQRNQFCFRDSDCAGDIPCRGRVCTDSTSITCRVIRNTLGAGNKFHKFSNSTPMFGWLDGQPQALACLFGHRLPGYTRIFQNRRGFRFTRETIRSWNEDLSQGMSAPYSILRLVKNLHQLVKDPRPYRLLVESPGQVTIEYKVPRVFEVLSEYQRSIEAVTIRHTGRTFKISRPCMPYTPTVGVTLLSLNDFDHDAPQLALAREDGSLNWDGDLESVSLYFLE